jgi:hypothetical protein
MQARLQISKKLWEDRCSKVGAAPKHCNLEKYKQKSKSIKIKSAKKREKSQETPFARNTGKGKIEKATVGAALEKLQTTAPTRLRLYLLSPGSGQA